MKNKITAGILSLVISYSAMAITTDEMISNSVEERMQLSNLENNRDYYNNSSQQDKLLILRVLYKKFKERENKDQAQKDEFSRVLAEVAEITTNNMINNVYFEVELPNFTHDVRDDINKDYLTNKLQLLPSTTYLLDFKERKITKDGKYEKSKYAHNYYVYVSHDSARNMTFITFPVDKRSSVFTGSDISYTKLVNQIKAIKPNFNFSE
jgi:hypothetical protein